MVVDLDRCIGCSACVVGCYSENNVAVVKREQVIKGREMSWIRVQRYFDDDKNAAKWLIMLSSAATTRPVSMCALFSPRSIAWRGLITRFNRCFGTRFCSQNDPYKVRRFNWFTLAGPSRSSGSSIPTLR